VSRQETHRDVGSGGLNLALRRAMPADARVREQRILNELPSQTLQGLNSVIASLRLASVVSCDGSLDLIRREW
jgi:hypothetical protein